MEVESTVETQAFPSFKTILMAGLAGGFVLNAIDTPWSLRTALTAGVIMLVVNRAFGFANVLMGIFPADLFLGFSASMVPGTLIASVVSAWIIDRRN